MATLFLIRVTHTTFSEGDWEAPASTYFAAVVGEFDIPDIVPATVVVEPDPALVVVVAIVTGGIEPVTGV